MNLQAKIKSFWHKNSQANLPQTIDVQAVARVFLSLIFQEVSWTHLLSHKLQGFKNILPVVRWILFIFGVSCLYNNMDP